MQCAHPARPCCASAATTGLMLRGDGPRDRKCGPDGAGDPRQRLPGPGAPCRAPPGARPWLPPLPTGALPSAARRQGRQVRPTRLQHGLARHGRAAPLPQSTRPASLAASPVATASRSAASSSVCDTLQQGLLRLRQRHAPLVSGGSQRPAKMSAGTMPRSLLSLRPLAGRAGSAPGRKSARCSGAAPAW